MNAPQQIQLSVEEALEFQEYRARIEGYVAGIRTMADYSMRIKVDSLIAARKPAEAKQEATDGGS